MIVVKSQEDLLEFDTGLQIFGEGDEDCCAKNYLDFEQIPVGTMVPDMTVGELLDSIKLKEDGFALKDIEGTPKWVQARSIQNGYYSNRTTVYIKHEGKLINLGSVAGDESE